MYARTIMLAVALAATASAQAQEANTAITTNGAQRLLRAATAWADIAPPRLVVFGEYSDRRFIDMMTPHHMMAVQMSTLALSRAQHAELKALAQSIVESQSAEIEEMKAIKMHLFGTDHTPSQMNPLNVENMGMASMHELEQASDFDCAFLDSMIPHHAAAIPMASVVLRRSEVAELRTLSQSIFAAQSAEIGKMESWRAAWCDSTSESMP